MSPHSKGATYKVDPFCIGDHFTGMAKINSDNRVFLKKNGENIVVGVYEESLK